MSSSSSPVSDGSLTSAAGEGKRAAFSPVLTPEAALLFNQASPSAYLRGNTRAVSLALAYLRYLESAGRRIFYDVNANSYLRPAIAKEYGFDPFERVVDWLAALLKNRTDP